MAGNTEGAVPISSVETDISSLSVKPGSSASLLEPAPSPMPRVAGPFAGVAGRSFFYLGLWVERFMAWRQRVPSTRAYRDLAELLQSQVVGSSPQLSPVPAPQALPLTAISVPATSVTAGTGLLPVQPAAASGSMVASTTDLLIDDPPIG